MLVPNVDGLLQPAVPISISNTNLIQNGYGSRCGCWCSFLSQHSERGCVSTTPENQLGTTGGPTPESELPASAPTPSPRTLTPVSARGLQKIDSRKISNAEDV